MDTTSNLANFLKNGSTYNKLFHTKFVLFCTVIVKNLKNWKEIHFWLCASNVVNFLTKDIISNK